MKNRSKFTDAVIILLLLVPLICICIVALITDCSDKETEQDEPENGLVLSEVMPNNTSGLHDGNYEYSDWIEIYNSGETSIVLTGYYLSDSVSDPYKWAMPEGMVIKPGEYIVFMASGKNECDDAGYYHTNFRLSSEGESVVLSNPERMIVIYEDYGFAPANTSFGRVLTDEGTYACKWLENATPGEENCAVYADFVYDLPAKVTGVVISEIMTNNTYTIYDSEGDYNDWVELHNISSSTVSLDGCALSDDLLDPMRWVFPQGTQLKPDEYMIVYLSGKDKYQNGEYHASFGIGDQDTVLILSDTLSRSIDRVELPELGQNISYGVGSDGSMKFFSMPTPGKENYSIGFEQLSFASSAQNKLIINEVSAASVENLSGAALADWIEIFNGTENSIDITGYGLSNNQKERFRFTFGKTVIAPGEYIVINCTGGDAVEGEAPFKIDCSGEELFLSDSNGFIIDSFETGKLRIGVSSGRKSDGSRLFYDSPTKGYQNSSLGYASYTPSPVFSSQGGYFKSRYNLTVTAPEGSVVRYTTDGSTPTKDSPILKKSLTIKESMTVKARAFSDSALPSDVVFATFLFEEPHTVPVVCISTDADGLFSKERGIYESSHEPGEEYPYLSANFWKDWERETTVEYFVDGEKQISFTAGAKIFGQYTRAYEQKSFALHIRDIYGASSVSYPFFDNGCTEYSSLVLRAAGQDQKYARMRDAYVCRLVKTGSDSLLAADSQPVALYINGEYFGLYNIREKLNEDYLARYEDVNKNTVDVVKGGLFAIAGDMKQFDELYAYLDSHNMTNMEYYEHICSLVDIESCMDYAIFMAFAINNDPGNVKMFKDKTEESKWRWILFDFDMSLRYSIYEESIEYSLDYNYICRTLLKNKEFRQQFIERFAYHLNNTFLPENTVNLWNSMANEISGEIERQNERWSVPTLYMWEKQVKRVETALSKRRDMLKDQLIEYFEISDAEVQRLFPNG